MPQKEISEVKLSRALEMFFLQNRIHLTIMNDPFAEKGKLIPTLGFTEF